MDNWEKIINGYREKAIAKEQNTVKYIDATVVAVREDYLRASVQLITGQTIDNMLNKSGEKLYVGRGVRVGYLTYPSKGWIDLANGEADPIHEGGGGGDIWEVETAAILNNDNFDNFVITEEEMVEISPATKIYYGAKPAFIVLQGMLCYFGAGNVSTSTYPCQLDGSTEIFQSVIDNKEFFSASSFSSMTSPEHTLMTYPNGNYTLVRYWSFTASTVQAVMNYRNSKLYIQQRIQPYSSRWTLDTGTKPTELKFYDDLSAEEKAAVVNNDTWKYRDRGVGTVRHNGSANLDQLADNIFVLPVVTAIHDTPTTPNGYPTPYGYAEVGNMCTVAGKEWIEVSYDVNAAILSGTGGYMPFKSQAEHDFAMGMTRRSEPQEGSDG